MSDAEDVNTLKDMKHHQEVSTVSKYKITNIEKIRRNLVSYMFISRSNLLSVTLEPNIVQDKTKSKEELNSKQIETGSQIRRQIQLQSANFSKNHALSKPRTNNLTAISKSLK